MGQLCLLLGHLWVCDETSELILIDISSIQLIIGSTTLFFNLPYQEYHHLVNELRFTVAIRRVSPPSPPRLHDRALTDIFIQLKQICSALTTVEFIYK
jgi:hypothetical protein